MFHQLLYPVANNLFLSFLVGIIPILVVLILLGIVRRPAWQAALAGLIVGLIIAIAVWQMPVGLAFDSTLNGFVFALLPVMWIVWNAMWLYNIAVRSGKFDLFRRWMIYNVPPDRRILLLVIGFSFGALLEGADPAFLRAYLLLRHSQHTDNLAGSVSGRSFVCHHTVFRLQLYQSVAD